MDNIDFAALPDAEAARLMAEMDGWRVVLDGNKWLLYPPGDDDWIYGTLTESDVGNWLLTRYETRYPHSQDAAVGWLSRMGLRWERQLVNANYNDGVVIVYGTYSESFTESPDCPTSRALCNAGWAAVQAREAGNG